MARGEKKRRDGMQNNQEGNFTVRTPFLWGLQSKIFVKCELRFYIEKTFRNTVLKFLFLI